jgi:hypothetical protein
MEDIFYKGIHLSEINKKYIELKNVWKVGHFFNLTGQYIHFVLSKHNLCKKINYFTEEDEKFLIENYEKYKDDWNLKELALIMNRTIPFISRKAKKLGLTNRNSKIPDKAKDNLSKKTKQRLKEKGHPKGFLGGKHSQETKKKISESTKKAWENKNHFFNSEEHKQNQSNIMSKNRANGVLSSNYSRAKQGTITIGGKTVFVRSSWEANIIAYYEFLKTKNEIKEWEYEPKTFWFELIKRGVRSYKPDLLITNIDGSQFWIEIKGWMDDKSKTKLKRFAKYYPNEKMSLIDKKRYNEIKKASSFIPNWGILDSDEYLSSVIKCSVDGCENKNHSKELCRKHYYKLYKK